MDGHDVGRVSVGGSWAGRMALATLICGLAAGPAAAAAIKGTVRFAGGPVEAKKLAVTVDQFVCGKEKDADSLLVSALGGIRNAVVWLDAPPQPVPSANMPMVVQLDQKECVFIPRVIMVPVGGTVEFLNSDRLLHNIHTISRDNLTYNRTQPKGRTIPLTFARPEIIRITCDLHSWMRAWVVVMAHPYYAVTNADGAFTLVNVPRGTYRLHIWQETLGVVSREVQVGGEDVTGVTVEMRVQ